jgi:two-component system chemotaxis response regulator CheY
VLVVDDDRDLVESLSDILALHGWDVVRAFDGVQAIEQWRESGVDAVVMDIVMPRMNGVAALRAIRQADPEAVVVLTTGYAGSQLIAEAKAGGALRIIPKPVDVAELLRVLESSVG